MTALQDVARQQSERLRAATTAVPAATVTAGRTGWWPSALLPFDTESTGIDVETDRVVTACAALLQPATPPAPWRVDVHSWLIQPDIDIHPDATAVHGITTDWAREHGAPAKTALDELADVLTDAMRAGIPVVGMNLTFDFTLLDRELRRHGLPTLEERINGPIRPVIDVYVLDKYVDPYRKGGRKLVDMCATYGVRIDGAHDSTADALASARVAYRIGQRAQLGFASLLGLYADRRRPEEVARTFQQVGRMSLADLHTAQAGWRAEQMASFAEYRRNRGEPLDDEDGSWPIRPWKAGDSRG